jgi:hypothetical protein
MLLVPVGSKRDETHGVDGLSDFNGLHSRQQDAEVQFYVFDVLD